MKSCVSLHRFRISADPLGGWFKFSELWGRAAPQRAQCPSSKKLRFSSLDGLRPINQSSKTVPYVQAQRPCLTALLCTAYASTMYG